VTHRHVRYPKDTPAEELPAAALVDTLERGDLTAWRPIAAAVRREPFGALAVRIGQLVDAFPMYGASVLWRAWIDRCRAREEGRRESRRTLTLYALRRSLGLTQVELARRLAMSQSDLSKLERRSDVRISTLGRYAEALGGRLRIVFEADRVSVDLGTRSRTRRSARR
jgi:DNA-binding Xre family transcriptional regulator